MTPMTKAKAYTKLGVMKAFAREVQEEKFSYRALGRLYRKVGREEFHHLCRQAACALGGYLEIDYPNERK